MDKLSSAHVYLRMPKVLQMTYNIHTICVVNSFFRHIIHYYLFLSGFILVVLGEVTDSAGLPNPPGETGINEIPWSSTLCVM